jgi:hypothetical protein
MTCIICLDEFSVPFSFISDDCLCKDNHVFCIGCIYEYIRFTFQISMYDGTCKCPLDRKSYKLKSQFARGILNAIEMNEKAMQLLNQEEEIVCSVCEGIKLNPEKKYKRKEYLDHWKSVHFNNDDHLLLLINKPIVPVDNNFILLAPELITPEAIEHQQWIEDQILIDIENRNLTELRIIRLQNKEKRFDVLNMWRKLWIDAKKLKDTISDVTNEWENQYDIIECEIRENQQKTDALFEIYNDDSRFRHIRKHENETIDQYIYRKQSITDQYRVCHGKIMEYIIFLKHRRTILKKGSTPEDIQNRSIILATWKQLWQDAKLLKETIKNESMESTEWDVSCNKLEIAIKENKEKSKDLFEPFRAENKINFMHRRANETLDEYTARKNAITDKQFICDGDLLDYVMFLKRKKEKEVILITWNKIWESIHILGNTIESDEWDDKYTEVVNIIKMNREKTDNLSNGSTNKQKYVYSEKILKSLKEKRIIFKQKVILEKWKTLWEDAKILKDIINIKYEHWMNLCDQLEDFVKENQKKTDELFTNQDRTRFINKRSDETLNEYDSRKESIDKGHMISGGNLLEYIHFLKEKKIKSQEISTDKARSKRQRRKQNKIINNLFTI